MISKCRIIVNSLFLLGAFVFCLGYSSAFQTPVTSPRLNAEDSAVFTNFAAGDLLYGLQKERADYLKHIDRKPDCELCTVDLFNNTFILYLIDNDEKFSIEKYEILRKKLIHHGLKILACQITNYLVTIVDDAISKGQAVEGMKSEDLIKLLCLKAIDYTIANEHKIHFILDGIDVDAIFSGTFEEEGKGFTNAELKYIYLNWHRLQHGVIFYDRGKVALAPWIQCPEIWEQLAETYNGTSVN